MSRLTRTVRLRACWEPTRLRGDFVKGCIKKPFPGKKRGVRGCQRKHHYGTVTVTISDDHNFDRQIIIPPIIFNGDSV